MRGITKSEKKVDSLAIECSMPTESVLVSYLNALQ